MLRRNKGESLAARRQNAYNGKCHPPSECLREHFKTLPTMSLQQAGVSIEDITRATNCSSIPILKGAEIFFKAREL